MMESGFMFDSKAICFLACFQGNVQGDLLALCAVLVPGSSVSRLLDSLQLSVKRSLSTTLHPHTA